MSMSGKAEWPPHRGVSLECTGNANERGLAGRERDIAGRVFDFSLSTVGPRPYVETVSFFCGGLPLIIRRGLLLRQAE